MALTEPIMYSRSRLMHRLYLLQMDIDLMAVMHETN